jgi:hypothetical protein
VGGDIVNGFFWNSIKLKWLPPNCWI